ncbi:MAG: hypothetical protein WA919_09415 [Coleofasciculaceae cyanobacterium]
MITNSRRYNINIHRASEKSVVLNLSLELELSPESAQAISEDLRTAALLTNEGRLLEAIARTDAEVINRVANELESVARQSWID